MSEPKISQWLSEPLPRSVAQSIERLAASEDVVRIAVMPDVHLSGEVCVGLAIATGRLIYPAAVGGDIGCGMAAIACDANASKLADAAVAGRLLSELGRCVPAMRHSRATLPALPDLLSQSPLSDSRLTKVVARDGRVQFATLGRGIHCPVARKSAMVTLALVASTIRSMGSPIRRAHTQANALPRLPVGMTKLSGAPVRAQWARLAWA